MSYNLMVFEPEAAPKDYPRFLEWYQRQVQWREDHSYGDPAVTSVRLRGWLSEMIAIFPSINADDLPEDEALASEYSIGKEFIYASFAWSKTEEAYAAVFALAGKLRLGFFNVSSDGQEVWQPSGGGLVLAHSKANRGLMNKVRGVFDKL